eukprot:3752007-Lingulodinium_polyedra.AAC.1
MLLARAPDACPNEPIPNGQVVALNLRGRALGFGDGAGLAGVPVPVRIQVAEVALARVALVAVRSDPGGHLDVGSLAYREA